MQAIEERARGRMEKALEALKRELSTLRSGRANPAMLDRVRVPCYGGESPLHHVATVSAPEARLLVVQPFDRAMLPEIERSILKANLGLTPNDDGQTLRIPLPALSQERRQEMAKAARQMGEKSKVVLRGVRRDAIEEIKKSEKKGTLPEDSSRRAQESIQKLADGFKKDIEYIVDSKEKEITNA
ncbi:ribosome recycling factor [Pasteuria penetrans]|uniref:ribosome recycling factor n=1 Tax=Pasteuria penetrans TaxID=86005 RepID=UPI000FADCBB3|nr:ribosome recycling factor [Pasteuria penetrans]